MKQHFCFSGKVFALVFPFSISFFYSIQFFFISLFLDLDTSESILKTKKSKKYYRIIFDKIFHEFIKIQKLIITFGVFKRRFLSKIGFSFRLISFGLLSARTKANPNPKRTQVKRVSLGSFLDWKCLTLHNFNQTLTFPQKTRKFS